MRYKVPNLRRDASNFFADVWMGKNRRFAVNESYCGTLTRLDRLDSNDTMSVYCVWVAWDTPEDEKGGGRAIKRPSLLFSYMVYAGIFDRPALRLKTLSPLEDLGMAAR